jgi:hypothetical protein
MIGYTRKVSRNDAAEVTQFRQMQYRRSPDLTIADESVLVWDESDDMGVVLAIWSTTGDLLATMRAELLQTAELVEAALDCPIPLTDFQCPVIILGRAATHGSCERLGLNSLLRLHFLFLARIIGIRYVLGRVYGEAARTRLMESLGYEFSRHPKGTCESAGTEGTHSPLFVAVLDLFRHGELAISTLSKRCAGLLTSFPLNEALAFPASERTGLEIGLARPGSVADPALS